MSAYPVMDSSTGTQQVEAMGIAVAEAEDVSGTVGSYMRLRPSEVSLPAVGLILAASALGLNTDVQDQAPAPLDMSSTVEVYGIRPSVGLEGPVREVVDVAESLRRIRATLGSNITKTAALLRVQRPTVYAWMEGRAVPRKQNLARLITLTEIAQWWGARSQAPLLERVSNNPALGDKVWGLLVSATLSLEKVTKCLEQAVALQSDSSRSIASILERHGLGVPEHAKQRARIDEITGKRMSDE